MANQSWKPDIYVTDYSKTNPSNQVQQSSSESLRKQDDTSNLNSLLRVVSEFKQIDSTATLDEYKELKDELRSKSEQLQQAVKKLEVKQRESMRLRAQLQQAKKETEKYKADLKLKTEETPLAELNENPLCEDNNVRGVDSMAPPTLVVLIITPKCSVYLL
ncbi:M protein, serotype 6-like [Argopecten irradians]|uniref:M protein, serotype 6-like n=1 Tax=Argopecten irradians TaxID=31199 RepID=UPI003714961D